MNLLKKSFEKHLKYFQTTKPLHSADVLVKYVKIKLSYLNTGNRNPCETRFYIYRLHFFQILWESYFKRILTILYHL